MRKASEKPLLALIEAGGVNDMPVIVPVAAMSDTLIEAIKTVKAAGYRVSSRGNQKPSSVAKTALAQPSWPNSPTARPPGCRRSRRSKTSIGVAASAYRKRRTNRAGERACALNTANNPAKPASSILLRRFSILLRRIRRQSFRRGSSGTAWCWLSAITGARHEWRGRGPRRCSRC